MAVYKENADGSLELIKKGQTLEEVVQVKQNAMQAQELAVSPCIKDILNTQIPEKENN